MRGFARARQNGPPILARLRNRGAAADVEANTPVQRDGGAAMNGMHGCAACMLLVSVAYEVAAQSPEVVQPAPEVVQPPPALIMRIEPVRPSTEPVFIPTEPVTPSTEPVLIPTEPVLPVARPAPPQPARKSR
ncbi:MAG: hypothetical protein WC809_12630 [Sinimarinibacterium sp.]|jgi:hypothetical protein